MSKMIRLVLVLSALACFVSAAPRRVHGQNSPHVAWGKVLNSTHIPPSSESLTFIGFISSRPLETLTDESFGCGYYAADGTWWLNTGNFASEWEIGDTLKVYFIARDRHSFEFQQVSGVLSGAGNDPFGTIILEPARRFRRVRNAIRGFSLRALLQSAEQMRLAWEAASSSQVLGYFVESAGADDESWRIIDFLPAAKSEGGLKLSYVPAEAPSGNARYRVRALLADGSLVASNIATPAASPESFALAQNYPNPFRAGQAATTRIRFSLPAAAHVRLIIYDLLGREQARLFDKPEPAGAYELFWDGRDSFGNSLPSGMYFYELQVGDQKMRKSLSLIH